MIEAAAAEQTWWLLDFYHERSRVLARFRVEAPLPTTATEMARRELLAAYPPAALPRRPGLFRQAQRSGTDDGGWALHRIARES